MDMAALMPGIASGLDAASMAIEEGILAALLPKDYGGCNLGHSLLSS